MIAEGLRWAVKGGVTTIIEIETAILIALVPLGVGIFWIHMVFLPLTITLRLILMDLLRGVWGAMVLHPLLEGVSLILVGMEEVPLHWEAQVVHQRVLLGGCWSHLILYLHLPTALEVGGLIHRPPGALVEGGLVLLVVLLVLDEALPLLDEVGGTVGHLVMLGVLGMGATTL